MSEWARKVDRKLRLLLAEFDEEYKMDKQTYQNYQEVRQQQRELVASLFAEADTKGLVDSKVRRRHSFVLAALRKTGWGAEFAEMEIEAYYKKVSK